MKKLMAVLFAATLAATVLFFPTPVANAQSQSMTVCRAWTSCQYGPPVWCEVRGGSVNGGSACNWQVWPGQAVACNGYVWVPGVGWMWQGFYFTCP